MPVSPTPMPAPIPTASTKAVSVGAAVPSSMPAAAPISPVMATARGLPRATRKPAMGPSTAPPIQQRDAVAAVAPREPPNSASSAGKKTGNTLVIPETKSMLAKASQSRAFASVSRSEVTRVTLLTSTSARATVRSREERHG